MHNMSEISQAQQIAYRRIEIKLEKWFRCAIICHNIISIIIYLAFIFDNGPTKIINVFEVLKLIGIFYFCLLVIIEIGVYNALYQKMMIQHRFEFETKIKSMKQHISISLFSEFLVIILQSSQMVIRYLFNYQNESILFGKPCL